MSQADEQSGGSRQLLASGARARKWLVGLVVAGVAAALTGYVTGGIRSAVDRVQGAFDDEPAPVSVTLDRSLHATRSPKLGSAHYVFTRRIGSLSYPTSGDLRQIPAWDAWAQREGGWEADQTGARIVIAGKSAVAVVLTGLTVDIVRRAPPPRGVVVAPFGGAPVGVRHFEVDLDREPPSVTSVPAEFTDQPAIDFPYRVSLTEPEVLDVVAFTRRCDCSWRAVLHWVSQGRSGVTTIDDDGSPFRTVASSGSTLYLARDGRFVKAAT